MESQGQENSVQTDPVKITLIFLESPHTIYFSTVASLFNLVHEHMGFAISLGLHFLGGGGGLLCTHKSLYASLLFICPLCIYVSGPGTDPERREENFCLPYNGDSGKL